MKLNFVQNKRKKEGEIKANAYSMISNRRKVGNLYIKNIGEILIVLSVGK